MKCKTPKDRIVEVTIAGENELMNYIIYYGDLYVTRSRTHRGIIEALEVADRLLDQILPTE